MSSPIKEDGIPIEMYLTQIRDNQSEYESKIRKRSTHLQSTEGISRKSSVQSNQPEHDDIEINDLVISPEDIPDEYELPEDQTGLLVVFNHENFHLQEIRKGTTKDKNDFIDCLTRLRYEVKNENIFQDLNKDKIKAELEKIRTMDHSKRSSLIVVFLTHGDVEGKLSPADGSQEIFITCEEVWNYFSNDKCPQLKGKPKVFIFQACKGEGRSRMSSKIKEDSPHRIKVANETYTLPTESDILVAYSTIEGKVSYRDEELGSWFIQEFCKNVTAYGRRDDLVTIMTRISKCVAYHYENYVYKQMPCFISTLTKKFYLCKSKQRGFLLDLYEQNKKLLEKIEGIERKLELQSKDRETKGREKKMLRSSSIQPKITERPKKLNTKNKQPKVNTGLGRITKIILWTIISLIIIAILYDIYFPL